MRARSVLSLSDGGVVLALIHVDKVDDDETRKVTQAQLARHFVGSFQVGLERGLLDRPFLCRPTGVDVDGHKRLGHANHDVPARRQLHRWIEHRTQIAFDLIARKQRQVFFIPFHVLRVRRHYHLHEVLGDAIAALALDKDLVDLAVIQIADRAFDKVALFIDFCRRDGFQRQLADLFPQALQVFIIAFDLGAGPLGPGGAYDQSGALRHLDLGGDFLELLALVILRLMPPPRAVLGIRTQ